MEKKTTNPIMRVFESFLFGLEKLGNKIPDPMLLFVFLSMAIILLSSILSSIGYSDVNPVTKKVVTVYNLLSRDGFVQILTSAVNNFTGLPALGMVLVCMLGVGVCDRSGLFLVGLRGLVGYAKGSDVKVIAVFALACILSHVAGGTGFVVMPPLGAIVFASIGRNPIAGMICAYATVSGAFASNLVITSMDVVTVSFTMAAARLVIPDLSLSPAITYYFSAVSALILIVTSVYLTIKVVEPRLGTYTGSNALMEDNHPITPKEEKALRYAVISGLVLIALVCVGVVPENGILRDSVNGSALSPKAPLMMGLTVIIAFLFFISGTVFGLNTGKFKGFKDIAGAMGKAMSDMGPYIALMFLIAQFLKYFDLSNIGIILAIKGANVLQASDFPVWIVLILFITMSSLLNILIGSASTKWAILSTVFVPLFMFLGYHPALAQMAYLIGDAVTNPICPTDAYFAMLLVLARRYDESIGIGTLLANMMPYALTFFVLMVAQLLLWFFLELPFGPGAPLMLL